MKKSRQARVGARRSGHCIKYVDKQTNIRDIQTFKQNIYKQISKKSDDEEEKVRVGARQSGHCSKYVYKQINIRDI